MSFPGAPSPEDDPFSAPADPLADLFASDLLSDPIADELTVPEQALPPVHANSPADPWASVRKVRGPNEPIYKKQKLRTANGVTVSAAKTNASLARRTRLVELVSEGCTIGAALEQIGVGRKAYEYWRRTDKIFAANVDVARAQNGHKSQAGWTGDSISFAATFFPEEYPSPGFHHDFARVLKNAKPGTITLINTFPNSGKTRIIENLICETLAQDSHHRFVVASKAVGHARKILGTIQDRMTNVTAFPEYIGRFGPFYVESQERSGKPWTRDYIKIAKNDSGQRDHNVQVMGWSGQILGSRVDTIILDDIQTTDNLSQVDAMLTKFRRDFYTRLKGGRIICVGNRIDCGDFYERLLELDIIEPENHIDYPAINSEGDSLWPERWPLDELAMTRKMVGERIWWTTYQQKPQLAGNATFDEKMIDEAKDWSRKVGSKKAGEPCVVSVDPGMDPGVCAIVAMTYDTDSIRVIDGEEHPQFSKQEDVIDLIESYVIRYQPQHVVIEAVHWQRALVRDERLEAMGRKYGFIPVPHNTNRNKLDPVMGVSAMASSFIRNEITFPYEGGPGAVSAARMDPILAELGAWRPNIPTRLLKQDFPMALWFGWLWIVQARHGMGIRTDSWRREAMPSWKIKVAS